MSKIVQAVNAMISNPDNISNVTRGKEETFFRYKDKYTWSMRKDASNHYLWFYPRSDIHELVRRETSSSGWEGVDMVSYSDTEIGTREAKASFTELYTILKEREFGVNKVLEDIIGDADPF